MSSGAKAYLVRHGQSEWNVARLTQGQAMHPVLTDLGRQQMEVAAQRIAEDLPPDCRPRVVSSDLLRARQSADIVASVLGLSAVALDPRLREQHLGALQGRPYEETWAHAHTHDWSDPSLPVAGGESSLQVSARMAAVLGETLEPAADEPVILISHGDAMLHAVAHLEGHKTHEAAWVEVGNGAVLRVGASLTWWR